MSAPTRKSDKICARHLERLAVVYIRQSSITQVHRNQESTKLQYSLVGTAEQLGWNPDRILTIDDDLGCSGASAIGRGGFQRLLAEIALDHVGIILGVEMSRLARSNKDWHQLLELCARFGTLIADLDGLYDPACYNDSLLLGLKGTMSEAELHILRQRLWQGKLRKAERGELGMPVPTGYLRRSSGEVVLDPDEEVREVVQMIFDTFERMGSIQGVLKELSDRKVQMGIRLRTGPDVGKLIWRRPHRGMIGNMLRNPIYAGTYGYGRRQMDPRKQQPGRPGTGRTTLLPPSEWHACVHDKFPAYITREQYQRNQQRLLENRADARGTPRHGSLLLAGLVVCGRCGYRMTTQYSRAKNGRLYSRYVCQHAKVHYGEPSCGGLSGGCVDEVVSERALTALTPSALEVSLKAARQIEREREKQHRIWEKRFERARYEVERAERQYQAVEPEHRLVARTLEENWEQALQTQRSLKEAYHRYQQNAPKGLSPKDIRQIQELAGNLPKLWHAPSTTVEDRKQVLRLLIETVVVNFDPNNEWVDLVVHWAGGSHTKQAIRRPVAKLTQLSEHDKLLDEMRRLREAGYTAGRIAQKLNEAGWTPPRQKNTFNERLIRAMLSRHGNVPRGPKAAPDGANEWWLSDLAKELDMPVPTLYTWMRKGWFETRRVNGQWVAIADRKEVRRLHQLRRKQRQRYLSKKT